MKISLQITALPKLYSTLAVLLLLFPTISTPQEGTKEKSEGHDLKAVYEADSLILDNGFRVILKPRHGVRRVSFRLVVDVGTVDFRCSERDLPHLLEHFLFSGTSKNNEAELDDLVHLYGGRWNATTDVDDTVYDLDVLSDYADFGVRILYEIITDSVFSESGYENVKSVVARENETNGYTHCTWYIRRKAGNPPTLTYRGSGGYPGGGRRIKREELIEAHETYYVPENMTLIVVGAFHKQSLLKVVENTFGEMESRSGSARSRKVARSLARKDAFKAVHLPAFIADSGVRIAYPRPGRHTEDRFPLVLLTWYLEKRFYEELRIKRGLAYTPEVKQHIYRHFGLIEAIADVDSEEADHVRELMLSEIVQLAEVPIDKQLLEEFKLGIVRSLARRLEGNHGISGFLMRNRDSFFRGKEEIDLASSIMQVSAADIQRVAQEYLTSDNLIEMRWTSEERPNVSYTSESPYSELIGTFGIFFGLFGIALNFYRKRRMSR
jgi:predicted Zn-dependent peptidase